MRVEEVAAFEGRLAKVTGPARSGKTQACALRVARLLEQGAEPAQMLVAVPTGAAAQAFQARLSRLCPPHLREKAAQVAVRRPVEVCAEVMDAPEVAALTGRRARVLNDAEYTFFLEDLKTLGQKNQRLHNMLLFFFAQWSNMRQEADWLLRGEETDLLAYARRVLASLGGALRHELPYLCANFLMGEQGAPFAQRFSHVLCDDFQDFSLAEQTAVALMAREQLMVFGCADLAVKANTDYPSPEGFERFERVRRGVEVLGLEGRHGPAGALALERALREAGAGEGDAAPAEGATAPTAREGAALIAWTNPEEELDGVCRAVQAWCAADPDRRPGDVAVAVPTKRWGGFAAKALRAHGFTADEAGLGRKLGGDPREQGMHGAASAWVSLRLLCDEADPLAWRAYTGFDNAIANSEAWAHIYKTAWDEGRGVCEVLDGLVAGQTHVVKGELVARRMQQGRAFLDQARGLRGPALAQAVGLAGVPDMEGLVAGLADDAGPVALLQAVQDWMSGRTADGKDGRDAVHVALFENLAGQEFPLVVMAGMVDGMVPGKDFFDIGKTDEARAKALADDVARTRLAATRATHTLVVSTFTQTTVEVAERSKMQVARIGAVMGGRVAHVSPSQLLARAGVQATPATPDALAALLA